MDLVRASPANAAGGQPTGPTGNPQDPHDSDETVYVEAATAEDLANVTVASVGAGGGGAGGGQPGGLHLTTITVAVPAPLSPSDVLQQHVVTSGPPQVALPTVPAPQETVRWKYEQNKAEKPLTSHSTGSSLVSYFLTNVTP